MPYSLNTVNTIAYGVAPPAYRLPGHTRIGAVRLQVADLARSIDFYQRVLGFRVLRRRPDDAALAPHGDDVALIELHQRPGARPAPPRGRPGLYHVAILLPDRPSLARFLRHIASLGVRAGMSDHQVSEAIYLQDPDNLGIEVYADRPRSAWRHDGEQLVMTTEPLDVRDLLAAAGSAPWPGMPPGTTIGHVHLHVGTLADAEAFYHRAVGFDKVVWSYSGALFLSVGGYHHHLGTNTWAADPSPPTGDEARLLEWELVLPTTPDVEQARTSVAAAGHMTEQDGGTTLVRDPWGTALRLRAADETPR